MDKRQIKEFILILLFILIIILECSVIKTVSANKITQYETQIEENNKQIQIIEEIKNQLHITAELLRENEQINNQFDVTLSEKWAECNAYQIDVLKENKAIQTQIDNIKQEQSKRKFIGNFKITYYCPCTKCNGGYGNKTALGTTMTPYKTIAVDPKIIPLGSNVEIQGHTYVAEDTGGAIKGNRVDICVQSHSEAYKYGVQENVPVYIIK